VVNLAAQVGTQYSIHNPYSYIENNITGFINLIDSAKTNKVKHFIYASSSSVYGNRKDPLLKKLIMLTNLLVLCSKQKDQ
jgi:UDP-glucuronate 4-epimerase